MTHPLTYPGRLPPTSGVFSGDRYVPLRAVGGEPAAAWTLGGEEDGVRLDEHLARLGAEPLDQRHRVIAVGSNAAPGQLYRKFVNQQVRPVIPLTLANVHGIAPGVSAHINKYGYLPAVPVTVPGVVSRLFVLWLDDAQIEVLDASEPNYDRRLVPDDIHPVTLVSGVRLRGCHIYVGKHGCLAGADGVPYPLESQRELIARLLDSSAALKKLCGDTPDEFIDKVKDIAVREAAYALFRSEGHASAQATGPLSTIET
ncbi:hypothetical protein GCM10009555_016550 [Acrocarpospora macrocephala]|uniref:Gamma-glutamylcyclotransferase n=2 Tax=Acrocarpospora macrocephala TaxID=150177 RepID=A0A5M3WE06_9ACTN|nr:hypothetical protein [Acrocarpospora macrocephala]GES07315.1 hypothetical protein Amac_009100 [Acrocarpospora macrocephala]